MCPLNFGCASTVCFCCQEQTSSPSLFAKAATKQCAIQEEVKSEKVKILSDNLSHSFEYLNTRYNGRQGKISGWGLTSFFFGTFPTRLQQTTITVLVAFLVIFQQNSQSYGKLYVKEMEKKDVFSAKGDDCGELSDHLKEGQLCAGGDERYGDIE